MVGPFALDGYDVLAPLDRVGRCWRAACLADGRAVVLRRWKGAAARLAEVRRLAAAWGSVAGDGVVPVRDVVCDGADLVVVTEAAGEPLEVLLARSGSLSPGQVVTLIVGLSAAVAAAHERGLAHGQVDASSVLVDVDGRPRLTNHVFGTGAESSADVAALVALANRCLGGEVPTALVTALASAADARGLSAQLLAAVRAEPLTLPAPTVCAADPHRWDQSRWRPVAVLVAAAVVFATIVGLWSGRREQAAGAALRPMTRPTPVVTPAPPWRDVVRELERGRARALARADREALAEVEVSGSWLWRRDMRTVRQLSSEHMHLRGLHMNVRSLRLRSMNGRRIVVRVVDAMTSYDVVDRGEVVVAHRRARGPRATDLVLVERNAEWRIQSTMAASAESMSA